MIVNAAVDTVKLYELYEEFYDVKERLEDTTTSFELMQEDISDELDGIQEQLQECGRKFRRFSCHQDSGRPPA